ncbi:unnamed protein product, partial [Effrenium voratum]
VASCAFRAAAALASAVDAGLQHGEVTMEAASKLEAQCKQVESKLKELMKKWPLEAPSQALTVLQEVESLAEGKDGDRRALHFQLQRLQAAFAFGVASCPKPEPPPSKAAEAAPEPEPAAPEPAAEEDGAMAALMRLQNRKKKEEEPPPEPAPDAAEPAAPAEAEAEAEAPAEAEAEPAPDPREAFQAEVPCWAELERRLKHMGSQLRASGATNLSVPEELLRMGKAMEVGLNRSTTGGEKEPQSLWQALKESAEPLQKFLSVLETRAELQGKGTAGLQAVQAG